MVELKHESIETRKCVNATEVLKTPQFWLLWMAVAGNTSAGHAILSSSKQMLTDIFSTSFPTIVTSAFILK